MFIKNHISQCNTFNNPVLKIIINEKCLRLIEKENIRSKVILILNRQLNASETQVSFIHQKLSTIVRAANIQVSVLHVLVPSRQTSRDPQGPQDYVAKCPRFQQKKGIFSYTSRAETPPLSSIVIPNLQASTLCITRSVSTL